MSASEGANTPPAAWQPFTFGGVAAFATARAGRVFAFELATAMMTAVCAMWFLHRAYCPVILQAIQTMPDTARVAQGALQGVTNTVIAESKFLGIAARPQPGEQIGDLFRVVDHWRPSTVDGRIMPEYPILNTAGGNPRTRGYL